MMVVDIPWHQHNRESGDEDPTDNGDEVSLVNLHVDGSDKLTYVQGSFSVDGITELESQLARFHVLLEKKWGHDHDNSFTYFPVDGSYSLQLTPHMLKEWARALVSVLY